MPTRNWEAGSYPRAMLAIPPRLADELRECPGIEWRSTTTATLAGADVFIVVEVDSAATEALRLQPFRKACVHVSLRVHVGRVGSVLVGLARLLFYPAYTNFEQPKVLELLGRAAQWETCVLEGTPEAVSDLASDRAVGERWRGASNLIASCTYGSGVRRLVVSEVVLAKVPENASAFGLMADGRLMHGCVQLFVIYSPDQGEVHDVPGA